MCFASKYCPNIPNSNFLRSISKRLLDLSEYQLVVGGDFNQVCNSQLDRSHASSHSQTDQASGNLISFAAELNILDVLTSKEFD